MSFQRNTVLALSFVLPFAAIVGCSGAPTRDNASSSVSAERVVATSAQLRVDGLGCPMCAESIAILMGNIDGVVDSNVDLSRGIVNVDLDGSTPVSAAQLRSAVDDGGFTFRSVTFEQ